MVTPDDSGDVAFVVGPEKSVAYLLVQEKPKGKRHIMANSVHCWQAIICLSLGSSFTHFAQL